MCRASRRASVMSREVARQGDAIVGERGQAMRRPAAVDPVAIIPASQAVFIGALLCAIATAIIATTMPRDRPARFAALSVATTGCFENWDGRPHPF